MVGALQNVTHNALLEIPWTGLRELFLFFPCLRQTELVRKKCSSFDAANCLI